RVLDFVWSRKLSNWMGKGRCHEVHDDPYLTRLSSSPLRTSASFHWQAKSGRQHGSHGSHGRYVYAIETRVRLVQYFMQAAGQGGIQPWHCAPAFVLAR